jgi:hypothetical protein
MSSTIYRYGTTPQTRSVVSTKNRIYAPRANEAALVQIGVMSSFSPSESRNVEPVRGIGYGDMVAELVPGVTEPMTISVTRTALYLTNIYQVFGYKAGVDGLVRSLRHHKFPFDIRQEIIFSEDTAHNSVSNTKPHTTATGETALKALITFFEGCWIQSYSTDYSADTAIIQEQVDIIVTDITDSSSTYNDSILTGNGFNDKKYKSTVWG